jgi:phosphoribosylformylglycinamidine synthase
MGSNNILSPSNEENDNIIIINVELKDISSYYLIQLQTGKQLLLDEILQKLFKTVSSNIQIHDDIVFFAPFINFYTTFSTTVIQILEKLKLVEPNSLIRFEPIYLANSTLPDPLIYKFFSSKTNYIKDLQNILNRNDNNIFQPISYYPELDSYTNTLLPARLKPEHQDTFSYFDIMSWIQCNSEHSRHWVFRTPLSNGSTLLNMIKNTLEHNPWITENSIIAFSDNSSAIRGIETPVMVYKTGNQDIKIYDIKTVVCHPCLTAETHNYPTYYHPFQGAATGVGGRIRDSLATGCGSVSLASLTGYSVNSTTLLVKASNGASDYANKIGEPCVGGYLRYHSKFEKPIMFSAGLGFIKDSHLYNGRDETLAKPGDIIVKIGPPAFKIGFGGSIQSSVTNTATDNDMTAIQRGDPYNGNKVARFLEYLALLDTPIIKKIHDQGAGGLGNVTTELLDGYDAIIDIEHLPAAIGMDTLEIWLSEYQEQMVFICTNENYPKLVELANSEGVLIYKLGTLLDTRNSTITIKRKRTFEYDSELVADTNLWNYKFTYNQMNKLEYLHQYSKPLQNISSVIERVQDESIFSKYHKHDYNDGCSESALEKSFKFHLTNKIDRCVGGCVVQQSCIGPFGIPMSNYSIVRVSTVSSGGILSAIGENIYVGQCINSWIDKTVIELLCNLVGVSGVVLNETKLSGNWMTYSKSEECLDVLYKGVSRLCYLLEKFGLAIDGGKDSLTMSMKQCNDRIDNLIISPPSLVLTSYSQITEESIEKRVTPLLRNIENTKLWYINVMNLMLNSDVDIVKVIELFEMVQKGITNGDILAVHDGSNVLSIVEEMAVCSYVNIEGVGPKGWNNECIYENHYLVVQTRENVNLPDWKTVGYIIGCKNNSEPSFCYKTLSSIFKERNKLSLLLDTSSIMNYKNPIFDDLLYFNPIGMYNWPKKPILLPLDKPILKNVKIVIIRDEGSNSHREMAAAFKQFAGVVCSDITINDLLIGNEVTHSGFLDNNIYVFVGGFSYGDVLGSGVATALIMRERLNEIFDKIFNDARKVILGVCNGCQILVEYGLFGENVKMARNLSGKFECRFLPVKYTLDDSVLTGSTLGIWVAHGEGRFKLSDGWDNNNAVIGVYSKKEYPFNPNGSDHGVIGLKSKKMKHYVIMPHPERSLFKWQCEYIPDEEKENDKYPDKYTPWYEFFSDIIKI